METKNAKITSTMLGYEDHGILTCYLQLDYGGAGQGFGGYSLQFKHQDDMHPDNFNYGMNFIQHILDTVGVEKWEDLTGKFIRVEAEHTRVNRIGNILEDKWFDPKELYTK